MAALIRSRVLKALEKWLSSSYFLIDDSIKADLEKWLEKTLSQYGSTLLSKSIKSLQDVLDGIEVSHVCICPFYTRRNNSSLYPRPSLW